MPSPHRPPRIGPELLGGCVTAAALVTLLARWLPLRFEWQPNELGIVSATTMARYPGQQEVVWFALCAAVGVALAWSIACALARQRFDDRGVFLLEALAVAMLAAALGLGRGLATLSIALLAGTAVWLARRLATTAPPEAVAARPSDAEPVRALRIAFVACIGLLVLLRSPVLWTSIGLFVRDIPDRDLALSHWAFQVETGQHLAWADALARGGFHGRDIFCLYGPLYDWAGVWVWELFSRSVRSWYLTVGLAEVAGATALALLAASVLRHRWLAALPLLGVVVINLRLGLPLLGLYWIGRWLRSDALRWAAAAGVTGGASLLYSQEFGMAFMVCAGLGMALRAAWRAALVFGLAASAIVAPLLLWYASQGALAPMLADLAQYPSWVMAGYGNLPFPSLVERLPLRLPLAGDEAAGMLRLGLWAGAVCVAGVALALPRHLWLRSPSSWLAAVRGELAGDPGRLLIFLVALFGVMSFRAVLGRSDLIHVHTVLPVSTLLAVVALDRIWSDWGVRTQRRALVAWRTALLASLLWLGGVLGWPAAGAVGYVAHSVQEISGLAAADRPPPRGNPTVQRVVDWIQEHSERDDPVLFLPNNAAYYFLSDRPNPTRFAVAHQLVTDAHRREALDDLRRDPPRFVVWDDSAMRLDGIPDRTVLGPELSAWLARHYEPTTRSGPVRIHGRKKPPNPTPRPANGPTGTDPEPR